MVVLGPFDFRATTRANTCFDRSNDVELSLGRFFPDPWREHSVLTRVHFRAIVLRHGESERHDLSGEGQIVHDDVQMPDTWRCLDGARPEHLHYAQILNSVLSPEDAGGQTFGECRSPCSGHWTHVSAK
jgi:hypothetical protein